MLVLVLLCVVVVGGTIWVVVLVCVVVGVTIGILLINSRNGAFDAVIPR